jgi:hypothetical protein
MENPRSEAPRRGASRRRWLATALAAIVVVLGACGSDETPPDRDFGTSGQGGAGGASATSTIGSGAGTASGQGGASSSSSGSGGSTPGQQTLCIDDSLTVGDLQLTEGDSEFDGNGPEVTITVDLSATTTTVELEACVTMRETVSDFTTGSRCVKQTFDAPNAGLLGDTAFEAIYTDTDHELDNVFSEATSLDLADNLVKSVSCVGDTNSNDVCSSTNGDCAMCLLNLGCFVVREP